MLFPACDPHCDNCTTQGPGKCDTGQCFSNYFIVHSRQTCARKEQHLNRNKGYGFGPIEVTISICNYNKEYHASGLLEKTGAFPSFGAFLDVLLVCPCHAGSDKQVFQQRQRLAHYFVSVQSYTRKCHQLNQLYI